MLIAEVVGALSAAHPALQTTHCEKLRLLRTLNPTLQMFKYNLKLNGSLAVEYIPRKLGSINCVFYRSWVPDEDLGATVGELVCWDLEVGHQHLDSFPV